MNAFISKIDSMVLLSDETRRVLATLTKHTQRMGPGERIIEAGDHSSTVNIVLSGWACRCKILRNGQRQITALLLPGDMCDPHGLLLREVDHTAHTLTTVTLAKAPGNIVRDLMASDPELAQVLWRQILEEIDIQREWTINLGQRTAVERIAHLCCEVSTRLEVVGLRNGHDCDMPITQSEIADITGLSAVHVNRSLQELRAAGLIELRNKRLTVLDKERLAELAMFDPGYLHRRVVVTR